MACVHSRSSLRTHGFIVSSHLVVLIISTARDCTPHSDSTSSSSTTVVNSEHGLRDRRPLRPIEETALIQARVL